MTPTLLALFLALTGARELAATTTHPTTMPFKAELDLAWHAKPQPVDSSVSVVTRGLNEHLTLLNAQATTAPASQPAMQMESYQLVILRAGDNPPKISREEGAEIQKQHLAHLRKLGKEGKILVAGPFGDQPDKTMRGMCLYKVGSIDEARQLAEDDPAVKAGRLKVEVMTWYVEKGYMVFPKAPVP
jgi:uncharacterized protein YciI